MVTSKNPQSDEDAISAKARENRARRAAERQGLTLRKCRRRDPRSLGYGTYSLANTETGDLVATKGKSGYGLTLAEIEAELDK